MGNLFSRLRSYLIFVPLVFIYTGVFGAVSLVTGIFDRSGRAQHQLARLWSKLILWTIGAPVQTTGLEKIDTSKPHLYIFNHLSAVDIPLIYSQLPFPFRIMAKKELFRYPFLGWHLRLSGQIPIESESALASMRSMKLAVQSLRSGMPLVVFPEGGRSNDGHIMPFQRGAFYAALKAQVEIIPGALAGTFEMLPMDTYHVHPRGLKMIVGEPILTAGMTARNMDALADRAQRAIEELYYANAGLRRSEAAQAENAPELHKLETRNQ
jgi:1-acyl-sn-glycerol-3-phosphate acyltransferase